MCGKWSLLFEGQVSSWRAGSWAWCRMPVARVEGRQVLVRRNSKGRGEDGDRDGGRVGVRTGKHETAIVPGGRVLHAALQQPAGRALQKYDGGAARGISEPAGRVDKDFLVAFVRHLVRSVGGDLLRLAIYAAVAETGVSEEDVKRIMAVLRREQAENSMWPSGFMPEL